MSHYPQYTDRERPLKARNWDTILSWVTAVTVLILIMAVVIGYKGQVDVTNSNPRSIPFTTGAAPPQR